MNMLFPSNFDGFKWQKKKVGREMNEGASWEGFEVETIED